MPNSLSKYELKTLGYLLMDVFYKWKLTDLDGFFNLVDQGAELKQGFAALLKRFTSAYPETSCEAGGPIMGYQPMGREEHVHTLLVEVVESAGLNHDEFLNIMNRAVSFQEETRELIRSFMLRVPPTIEVDGESNFSTVQEILGDQFISPEQIACSCRLVCTQEQLQKLVRTLPKESLLREIRKRGFVLMPAPNKRAQESDLYWLHSRLFYEPYNIRRYNHESGRFRTHVVGFDQWIAVRPGVVPHTTEKVYGEQYYYLPTEEVVPTSTQMMWCVKVHGHIMKKSLLGDFSVRTSTVRDDGCHDLVRPNGDLRKTRADISLYDSTPSECVGYRSVGLASCLKL
jgi:hypothetical protein